MMKAYLIESAAGLFLVEKTGKISEKALFPANPRDAAVFLAQVQNGQLPESLVEFAKNLSRLNLEKVTVDSDATARLARSILKTDVILDENDETISKLRNRLPTILVRLRIVESKDSYEQFVRDVSLELARASITEATTKRDLYAIQTVRYIEDLDKMLNLMAGRVREWYGLHFPELDRMIEKHDSYIRLVKNLGSRDSFTRENLLSQGIPEDKSREISDVAAKSSGAEIPQTDLDWLREVSAEVLELYKQRETAEKYTDRVMNEVAPNMSSLLGAVLSAKLLSMAGGLDNVAKMPASTLQVLGAEKALFRTIKTGAPPPKHGIIFQYAAIHQSPKWLRGKIARAVAGKLAIAARMDAFGGSNSGEKLRGALDKKISDLKDRYQAPPTKKKYAPQPWRQAPREVRRDLQDPRSGQRQAGYGESFPGKHRLRGRNR